MFKNFKGPKYQDSFLTILKVQRLMFYPRQIYLVRWPLNIGKHRGLKIGKYPYMLSYRQCIT
jgi:hypothetical protein